MKKCTNGQEKNVCFGQLKNSRGFRSSGLSTYDLSTLYTTLPHNLNKKKLINLNLTTFHREGTLYLACDYKIASFTSDDKNGLNVGLAKRFETLRYIFLIIFSLDLVLRYTEKRISDGS